MCTVTYLPFLKGQLVTANRDETPLRSARGLSVHQNAHKANFQIAREPVHGGTNMAVALTGDAYVLLNGAFEAHPFGRQYRLSRGIVVLESLNQPSLESFQSVFDFENIEPFTLLRFGDSIEDLRWDGSNTKHQIHDKSQPRLWASAQLYTEPVRAKRRKWFEQLLAKKPSPEEVWNFHQYGGDGDGRNDMVMNRDNLVRTVSITQIIGFKQPIEVQHLNLLNGKVQRLEL
jgi:hypothetical protein